MSCPYARTFTTSAGIPVDDDQYSQTAGEKGPITLTDFRLIEKIAHFDRERIPERVVHAVGSGAHGYFELTNPDFEKYTKAKLFSGVGKKTPVFARFSTVGGESGSSDTARDPRGFAVKFYTEEGNWDFVGNNTPVFFIRDPIKFPDFIHTQKRNPQTHLKDPNMFWDFLSLTPEAAHQVTILFSDRGTPRGYRHMNGYYGHTLKLVNKEGKINFVKFHFKTKQGIQNLTAEESTKLSGENPDYSQQDLFESIQKGDYPGWDLYAQIMPEHELTTYRWNPLDITKVWPHADYPLIPVGKMVLNKNPLNYFAEVEQSAFEPSNLVPGIEPSNDKMLVGRMFSYADTHRYRLGPNYNQIPINQPRNALPYNGQVDGPMAIDGNKGNLPNYYPNSFSNVHPQRPFNKSPASIEAEHGVAHAPITHGEVKRHVILPSDDDFVQPGNLYRKFSDAEKQRLVDNISGHLVNAEQFLQERLVNIFTKCDSDYGRRVREGLKLKGSKI
jgi:catalase